MDRYVVIGNPVSHSLSPAIQRRFAEATGETLSYETLLVPIGEFTTHVRRFFDEGGRGANVTLPFKIDARGFADRASERAEAAGAANVLVARDGRIEADNTDGTGLIRDLIDNERVRIEGANVLLLGAGGAASGVIAPLLAERPSRLVLANRTVERAASLARRFRGEGPIESVSLAAIPRDRHDIIVNATSSSVHGESLAIADDVFSSAGLAYDMAYGPAARAFLERARACGMRARDGLGMLVEQAAESFLLWRGVRPRTAPVLAELRAQLS